MSDDMPSTVEAQAIDWLIRQRDTAFDDWEGFTTWLELGPDHAAIYDRLASLDADLSHLPKPVEETAVPERSIIASRRTWIGGAMAAALVAIVGFSMLNSGITRIETDAGEHRTVALADGSRIEVNGGTLIELDEDKPRFVRLESGEAMFHVVHREGDPFMVEAGKARLVDMGTAFNVIRRRDALSVASKLRMPVAVRKYGLSPLIASAAGAKDSLSTMVRRLRKFPRILAERPA